MQNQSGKLLKMNHISVLCNAFPDETTYLCYDSARYPSDLIFQIHTQFGVVETLPDSELLDIDTQGCDIFISSFEKITGPQRMAFLNQFQKELSEWGYKPYLAQNVDDISVSSPINSELKAYCEQQNSVKLQSSKCVLLITSFLGWKLAAHYMGEFDPNASPTKTIFYLIDDRQADMEQFLSVYQLNPMEEATDALLQRIAFLNDYKTKLMCLKPQQ